MLFNLFVFFVVVVVVCFCFCFFLLFFLLFEGDMELHGDLRCCGVVNIFVRYCGDLKQYNTECGFSDLNLRYSVKRNILQTFCGVVVCSLTVVSIKRGTLRTFFISV